MGLSEIKKRMLLRNIKEKKKLEIMFKELEEIIKKIQEVKKDIEKFQKRWGKYISNQPEIINALSAELLGIKNLDSNLEMKIALDILTLSEEKKITMLPLSELVAMIRDANIGFPITLKDIEKAIKYLIKKKLIKGVIEIRGIKYIQIKSFDSDIETILKRFKGKETITLAEVIDELGWDVNRAEKTLEEMVKLGLAVKEDYPPSYHLVKISD